MCSTSVYSTPDKNLECFISRMKRKSQSSLIHGISHKGNNNAFFYHNIYEINVRYTILVTAINFRSFYSQLFSNINCDIFLFNNDVEHTWMHRQHTLKSFPFVFTSFIYA